MRVERLGFQFRMILHTHKTGMTRNLNDLRQHAIGRHAGEAHTARLQPFLVVDVHLIAVPVTFLDTWNAAMDGAPKAPVAKNGGVRPEPHRAAEITARHSSL